MGPKQHEREQIEAVESIFSMCFADFDAVK